MPDPVFRYPLLNWETSGLFRQVYDLDGARYEHPGLDGVDGAGNTLGALIVACADAKVHAVHKVGDGWGDGTFGNCVILDHLNTPYYTVTAHMQALYVFEGDMVKAGDGLGTVGTTGKTTGAHVHWGCCTRDGFGPQRYLDPQTGIWKIGGNSGLVDPGQFVVPPKPPLTLEERIARAERILARSIDRDGDGRGDLTDEEALEWADAQGISVILTAQRQSLAMQGKLRD